MTLFSCADLCGSDGMMADPSGMLIYKPCVSAEIEFYQSTTSQHPDFAALMPTFMGTLQRGQSKQLQDLLVTGHGESPAGPSSMILPTPDLEKSTTNPTEASSLLRGKKLDTDQVLVLENVLAGFKRPNFMDIKLGKRLWGDDAAPAKRSRLDDVASKTTSGSLGFRIAGMQIWVPSNSLGIEGKYRAYDKFYGRSLTKDNVKEAFSILLCLNSDNSRAYVEDIIRDIDSSLEDIESVLTSKESRMYSTSLLLVFEGDAEARREIIDAAISKAMRQNEGQLEEESGKGNSEMDSEEDEDEDEEDESKLFDVRVIDFAHAAWTPGQGRDENMLFGIGNVRKIIRGLVK